VRQTSQRHARIVGHHVSIVLHHRIKISTYKTQKGCTGKDVSLTRGFAASPGVGPGATIGTLRTGYPHVQAPSQDKRQGGGACPRVPRPGSHLLAQGNSGATACPHGSGSCLRAALGPPRVAWATAPAFWLRAASELQRVPSAGSTSCKQLNKYPLAT
jgi:hypothetical protein